MILAIRSDSEIVYVGIWDKDKEIAAKKWNAERGLSNQILLVINDLCEKSDIKIKNLKGLVVFEGPGSYTGLRISASVANTLAYSNEIPVVGETGEDWILKGKKSLALRKASHMVTPKYGGEVHITKPKK